MSADDVKKAVTEQTNGVVKVDAKSAHGKSITTVFITYESLAAATAAVEKGVEFAGDRPVMQVLEETRGVKRTAEQTAVSKRSRADKRAVTRVLLVSGFPLGTDASSLESYFDTQGSVTKVEMGHSPTPFALIYMSHAEFAERAKQELSGNLFRGSSLSIEFAFDDTPESNPVSQRRVHLNLDPKAAGNTEVTVGELLNMLTSIIDAPGTKHGAFVDPHGMICF